MKFDEINSRQKSNAEKSASNGKQTRQNKLDRTQMCKKVKNLFLEGPCVFKWNLEQLNLKIDKNQIYWKQIKI